MRRTTFWLTSELAVALISGNAWAQAAAPDTQQAVAPATLTTAARHAGHHHHRRHRVSSAVPPAIAPQPQPAAQAERSEPAPVPNEDVGPPRESTDQTTVDPGSPQIHYPSLGNGFLPGSSSQTLENLRSSEIPGATVHVPVEQLPKTLPPPTANGAGTASGNGQ